jgi:murein DD-endopeptidase MepM/ murein hydrolase activator NlpD
LQVVHPDASTSITSAPISCGRSRSTSAHRRRRLIARLGAATLVAGAAAAVTLRTTPSPAAAAAVAIQQFPVQGRCDYAADSFGAPRDGGRKHEGIDIMPRSGKAGDYIYAAVDGTLTRQLFAIDQPLAGNGWKLQQPDGTYFYYFHMSEFAPGLHTGSTVVAGQILGKVGQTGNAGGPHLHFEVHPQGGAAVDPYPTIRAVDGCQTTAVPPQPINAFDPGLQPAIRLSQTK